MSAFCVVAVAGVGALGIKVLMMGLGLALGYGLWYIARVGLHGV